MLPAVDLSAGGAVNRCIAVSGRGSQEFTCLMVDAIPCLDVVSKSQCFPRYTYRPFPD